MSHQWTEAQVKPFRQLGHRINTKRTYWKFSTPILRWNPPGSQSL
jgi:hypothetical protein